MNFVPVASDMSDLVDKVIWLREHDSIAEAIGRRGREFAESLSVDKELARSRNTITTALRLFSGKPIAVLDFCSGRNGRTVLRSGWLEPDAAGVATAGTLSSLDIEWSAPSRDLLITFEISPSPLAMSNPQRLTVTVGERSYGSLPCRDDS